MPSNNGGQINRLEDLLVLNDFDFIESSYLLILKRNPDPDGLIYYTKRLRSGIGRLDILCQLINSKEAIPVPWLKKALRLHLLSKIPLLGLLFRKTEREILARLYNIESRLSISYDPLVSQINEVQSLQLDISKGIKALRQVPQGNEDVYEVESRRRPKEITKEDFDSDWYLSQYPDVAKAGIDPYVHYVNSGREEGRLALRKGGVQPQLQGPDGLEKAALVEAANKWFRKPLISVIMPVFNTPEKWLREAIDSVIAQTYPLWELCVVDDASTEGHVKLVLSQYQSEDSRIKVSYQSINKRVSASSNIALDMAMGDYVVLFDHDDLLESHALHRVAEAIIERFPDIIYTDELLVSENAEKIIGHAFRPAFSLELLRSHPYIVHLVAYRKELLKSIGGFDESLHISQDYDLLLRSVERANHIVHIPEALYRWRTHEASEGHSKKEAVMEVSRRVLAGHLERSGCVATVDNGLAFNFFDTRYPLQPGTRVAIIIPTKNHGKLVKQCIESLERTIFDVEYDVVIVDHASDDCASIEYFEQLSERHTVFRYDGEFNFSTINNWAIRQLSESYSHYLLCNNDIEAINNGWLERMVELGQQRDVGIVGAKLYYPDRTTIQHAGVCVGMFGAAEHFGKFMDRYLNGTDEPNPGYIGSLITNREVSAVTAACMLIRSDAFEWVSGFDEYAKVGFGDVDLCLRIRQAGYRVVFSPHVELIHHESLSRGKSQGDPHPDDSGYFLDRWSAFIENGDPFYNPNLTLFNTYWGLKRQEEFEFQKGAMEKFRSIRKLI